MFEQLATETQRNIYMGT